MRHRQAPADDQRQECVCDEIDPADVPCIVCTCAYDMGIGPPPGCRRWPPSAPAAPAIKRSWWRLRWRLWLRCAIAVACGVGAWILTDELTWRFGVGALVGMAFVVVQDWASHALLRD